MSPRHHTYYLLGRDAFIPSFSLTLALSAAHSPNAAKSPRSSGAWLRCFHAINYSDDPLPSAPASPKKKQINQDFVPLLSLSLLADV